jgi:hypothetical protein
MLAVTVAIAIKAGLEAPGIMTTAADAGTKDLRCISLDVVWGQGVHIIRGSRALHATHARKNVTDAGLPIFVNSLSQTHKAEMRGKISIVVFWHGVHVSFNVGLENCDNIHVIRMLDRPKKSTTLCTIVMEKAELGLETEIQKKGMAEVEDIQRIFPYRSQNLKSRVKPRNRQSQNVS